VKRIGLLVALVVSSFSLAVIPAATASADGTTSTTTFAASASQTAVFGSDWVMPVTVAGTGDYPPPVDATSGTVNILIEGQPGTYATGLPLAPGGQAFFSPSSAKPPLGAGTYKVTAVFVPAAGSGLAPSQTAAPAVLTVTAIRLSTSFTVQTVTIHDKPGAEVSVTVQPPGHNQGIPAGSWDVKAVTASGALAFHKKIVTKANPAKPTTQALTPGLKPGSTYTVSATFSPTPSLAGGYTVSNGTPQSTNVAAESPGEVLSTPVTTPVWAPIGIGIGLVLLIAATIVLLVRARRKPVITSQTTAAQP
jgi:hypothetical protein